MRAIVALGTFDGVHRGHQRIIKDTVSLARRMKLPSIVTTFDPHPQQFICPERGLKLLTTLTERKALLKEQGVDRVVVFKFTERLRRMSHERFVVKYLVEKLKAAQVLVGYDYAFGLDRRGDVRELRRLGEKYGFTVKMVRPVKEGGHIIKSKLIRDLLSRGKFDHAVHLLGHPYRVTGKVVRGTGRGGEIGFPTANLFVDPHKLIPHHGVYAGRWGKKKCAVNIGARPTFGVGGVAVEVHILKFHKKLYDRTLAVDLYKMVREERQFADVKRLRAQIGKDVAIAERA
ncbi:bifunctional riboflavin kinase/FAD synthetase [Candidatus Saganbacteria bacterium]|nr:bifunctional riboflavin kinase/FAD synthetase [Candidatus Saganbacteria bacterium]